MACAPFGIELAGPAEFDRSRLSLEIEATRLRYRGVLIHLRVATCNKNLCMEASVAERMYDLSGDVILCFQQDSKEDLKARNSKQRLA